MTGNDDRVTAQRGAAGDSTRWELERANGRTRFILRRGVLSWGIPAALLTVFYKVVQEQGLVWSPQMTDSLRTAIVVAVIVFPVCGWLFGRWLWDTGETRYHARVRGDREEQ
jgi:hypothetical protein